MTFHSPRRQYLTLNLRAFLQEMDGRAQDLASLWPALNTRRGPNLGQDATKRDFEASDTKVRIFGASPFFLLLASPSFLAAKNPENRTIPRIHDSLVHTKTRRRQTSWRPRFLLDGHHARDPLSRSPPRPQGSKNYSMQSDELLAIARVMPEVNRSRSHSSGDSYSHNFGGFDISRTNISNAWTGL